MMKNPWIFPATTLMIGVIAGYLSGKNMTPEVKAPAEQSSQNARSSTRVESTHAETAKRPVRPSGISDISKMPGNLSRIQAMMDFYSGLTPEQLEAEARKLERLPMNERVLASILLFARWGESDPTAAMTFSNTMGFTGMFVRPSILQSWASSDPATAAKYLSLNPREFAMMGAMGGPMGGQGASSIIAGEWARQDPTAALAWANGLTGNDRKQAMESVIAEMAKTDPKKAAEKLASLSGETGDAYRSVATQYGATNFSEAQAWIKTLPADQQENAMASAISGLSNKDPEAAAKQVALMQPGAAKNQAVNDVVRDLARLNPQAAGDFLKLQGSPDEIGGAMRELMPTWVSQNANAALEFANSYEPGNARDDALQSWVWSNNSSEPKVLIKVAETITDENNRNRSIAVAASRWMKEDPEAAKSYVQQSPLLSDAEKTRIVEGRSMWGGGRGRGQ